MAFGLIAAASGSASANTFGSWESRGSNRCFSVDPSSFSGLIGAYCQGTAHDNPFRYFTEISNGYTVKFSSYFDGQCITEDGSSDWDQVYMSDCNGSNAQQWYVHGGVNGQAFMNAGSGMCLDGNGSGSMYVHTCDYSGPAGQNTNLYQNWH
ncbi:ricin-type beta-trefoil lectin domain protein [Streptacidiphilus sp. MAP12-33]|uniref:ricin-type beta-trefoil lectin domain protein n=1 Tax=Streptacidiphilus sp. MAP12-33 TaxID=3156266 RepID=UPI003516B2EC